MIRKGISVHIDDPRWRKAVPKPVTLVRDFAYRAAIAALPGPPPPLEVTVVLADDARVHALNLEFRGKDTPTNVLSFPNHECRSPDECAAMLAQTDEPFYLGDVILAYETVVSEAEGRAIPVAHHLAHLVTHGMLHLLGYDHQTAPDAMRMEALEVAVLGATGIPDPYTLKP